MDIEIKWVLSPLKTLGIGLEYSVPKPCLLCVFSLITREWLKEGEDLGVSGFSSSPLIKLQVSKSSCDL